MKFSSIGITAVVARILAPRDFGIFAVATTAFTIVTAIGEFGVTTCLSRADLDVESLAPTLWSVSLGTSLISAAALEHFAVPIATALGSSAGASPLRVMSILMVLWGVTAVPTAQCIRDFKQDKIFLANVLSYIPSTVILLVLAEHGSGAMAFAWSRVAGQVTSCVIIMLSVPKLHRPGLSRAALSILYRYGIPLAIANFVGYILQNVDYVLIGHLMGPVLLGTYVLAFNVASWSSSLLLSVLATVAMPAFSRVKQDTTRLMAATADSVRAVMLVAAPMCTLVMALARPIVLTIYGNHWAAAAPVLMILSIYGLISITGGLFSNMLAALGKSKSVLAIQLIWLAVLVPAMTIGVRKDGIVGAAIAHIVVIGPIVLPCYLIALKRAMDIRLRLILRAALPLILVAAIAGFLAWLTASLFDSPAAQLVAGMAVGGSFYLLVTAPQVIALLGRGLVMRPRVRRLLRAYNDIGRTLGLPVALHARHAVRRRRGGLEIYFGGLSDHNGNRRGGIGVLVLQRRRVLSISLLVLTFILTAIAFSTQPWTYQASASVVFIPSQSFGALEGGGNRYLAFEVSLNELGDVIRYEVTSTAEENALAADGESSGYTITDPTDTSSPILLVSSSGNDEENVETTLSAVVAEITSQLDAMQAGLKPRDKITDKVLTFVTAPTRVSSAKVRTAIVSLVAGLIVSLGILLLVDSARTRHANRNRQRHEPGQALKEATRAPDRSPVQPPVSVPNSRADIELERDMQPHTPQHRQDYGPRPYVQQRATRADERMTRRG